jgi:hypothetical protein
MKYDNLVEQFLKYFPELSGIADQKRRDWEGDPGEEPLVHVFFGDVVTPFILDMFSSSEDNVSLNKIFEFLEMMAKSNDSRVREVVTDSVLEKLGDDLKILRTARSYMGNETRKLSHQVEKFWGREK